MSETITPGVVIDGYTVYPEGWMWVLALAINGVSWAMKEVEKPEFGEKVKDYLKREKNYKTAMLIGFHLERINQLKKELL